MIKPKRPEWEILERYWNRPDALVKTLPISSTELRRKTKQYYNNLPK